jgi:error-prone DNA polymerase
LAYVPAEDPAVYDMICHADTVGVFQIESRAQMSMLPRLQPRCFYDLVIEVAIVRPGPIQGGMVHPYLRRRAGKEPVTYPSEAVRDVLHKTLGVPLFQEQAMKLAVVAAGFTPGEADRLRRSMAAWRRSSAIDTFQEKLIGGMRANGYSAEFAEQLFNQIRGFGEYGFPESHAASFALLVYVSAWLKRYHPAAFAAALINSQPMGFYAPAQLVRDAREHGVEVRPVDVNASAYDCSLEEKGLRDLGIKGLKEKQLTRAVPLPQSLNPSIPQSLNPLIPQSLPSEWGRNGPALRLGLRLIKGISESGVAAIVQAHKEGGPFHSIADVARRSGVSRALLARLAAGDAFGSLGLDRREALWWVLALEEELPLFAGVDPDEPAAGLPQMQLAEHVVRDYESLGLSLKAHPMELIRPYLADARVQTARQINAGKQGGRVNAAGLVLVRQRPSTALGIVFMTIEDETGVVNLVVRPKVYERFRAVAATATALVAQGRIERAGEVVHVQVERMTPVNAWMEPPQVKSRNFH